MNELKLLKGSPVEVCPGLSVHPLTLDEISEIGEEIYNSYLRVYTINKSILNNIAQEIPKDELNEVYNYNELEFLLYICSKDTYTAYFFFESLKVFLKSDVEIVEDVGITIKNDKFSELLTNDTFIGIKKIIYKQNFLKDSENANFKPANDKAKALLEKMNKVKEKIQKQNNEEGLSLKDIISIVANYSNDINIITIWNLTVSQLYEAYLRLIVWDDYHNKYILLPHTTDSQSLDLKHWATDINKIK